MSSPLHLGLTPWLAPIGRNAAQLSRQAALAESWGYESFWLPENHFNDDGAIPDPLMLLAAVAGATQRIRLATTSYLLPLRHPVQAAEQVAVLDQLSDGRVILGVGRGYQAETFGVFNVRPQDKRARFEVCLAEMCDAWQGKPIGASGQEAGDAGKSVRLSPRPVQEPHPPIWVAAFGPKALSQVGRLGLPYLASPMESRQTLTENYARHAQACDEGGHPVPPEIPIMRTVFVSRDTDKVGEIRSLLERQAETLRRQASGLMARRIPERIDDWALVGAPDEVLEGIHGYRQSLGMTHLIATRLRIVGADPQQLESSVQLLAELVVAEAGQPRRQ